MPTLRPKQNRKNSSDPLMRSVKRSARSARAQGSAVTNSLFSFSFFKLALTGGVVLGFVALFFISGVFGETRINLSINTNPDLENGLVAHWTFDGDGITVDQILDRSGQGNHGGFFNGATTTATVRGRIGQALEFDGDDEYINVSNTPALNGTTTVSAWFKHAESDDGSGVIIQVGSGTGSKRVIRIGCNSGKLCGMTDTGGDWTNRTVYGATAFTINEWHHVVFTVENYEDLVIYLDGEIDGTQTLAADKLALDVESGGADIGGDGSGGWRAFGGLIDDVRVYNRSLSATEIQRLYQLGATTKFNTTINTNPDLENGLIAHYTFDGSDLLQNVVDRSGNGNTGYLTGFTSTTTVRGRIGQALLFTGSTTGVNIGDVDVVGAITISAWVRPTTYNNWDNIVRKTWTSQTSPWTIYNLGFNNDASALGAMSITVGSTNYNTQTTTVVPLNEWTHLLGTYDGETVRVYFNGVEESNDTSPSGDLASNDMDTFIGRNPLQSGEQITGTIDDVRIYNRALSAVEAARLHELGATTHINTSINTNPDLENGLVGHWTFDGADLHQNATDRSGNGNHGYLTNFTSTTTVRGRIGQALLFDGSDDYAYADDSSSLDSPGTANMLTISSWFKVNDHLTGYRGIAGKYTSTGNNRAYLLSKDNGTDKYCFYISTDGTYSVDVTWFETCTDSALNTGQWYYLTGVYDGTTAMVYLDGVLQADTNAVSGLYGDGTAIFEIGAFNLGNYFDGIIDDVRVYDQTLSAEEVQRLYDLGR